MTNYQLTLESGATLPLSSCCKIQSRHSHCQKINPNNSHLFGHKLNCLALDLLKHNAQSSEEVDHMAGAQRQGDCSSHSIPQLHYIKCNFEMHLKATSSQNKRLDGYLAYAIATTCFTCT